MPLEHPDQKFFEEACGYAQLGMWTDANEALENIDPFNKTAPEILIIRVAIYQELKRWELMAEVAGKLTEIQPYEVQGIISYAYAVRRCQSIEAAREILLSAESRFYNEAIIKYNLACYASVLGDVELAKQYLRKCFQIDAGWRLQALEDEDLKPLWDSL